MINGVLEIVAAVLFAVVGLDKGFDTIWLCIAGVYLVCGILNLIIYSVKNYRKQKAAEKAAAEKAASAGTPVKVEPAEKIAAEAQTKLQNTEVTNG